MNKKETSLETLFRLLDTTLGVMNEACRMHYKKGKSAVESIEYIAEYLSNTDGLDEDLTDE
jgi:hypothetical protein